jgi:hypothetical protein
MPWATPPLDLSFDLAEMGGEPRGPRRHGAGAATEDGLVLAAELRRHASQPGDRQRAVGDATDPDVTVGDLEVAHQGLEVVGRDLQQLTAGVLGGPPLPRRPRCR